MNRNKCECGGTKIMTDTDYKTIDNVRYFIENYVCSNSRCTTTGGFYTEIEDS